MQPQGRDGRGGNNARPMNFGFPAFPDPFAGFGGRPGGFLSDMFENDPFFSDPFFTRPFGAPFGSGSLFGPSGIFNQGLFGIGQGNLSVQRPFSNGQGQGNLLDQRPYISSPAKRSKITKNLDRLGAALEGNRRNIPIEEGSRRGVQIEELTEDHEDHDGVGNGQPSSNQQPIIEHPEDDEKTDNDRYQPQITSRPQSRGTSRPANNPVRSYSFQSSSVMYGGHNGPYYETQTTRRQGPNGVIEEEHQEKDSTSGRATHRVSRGLGDKGRSLTRKRNAEGREEKLDTLHNLGEDEVEDFERTWETLADSNLPRSNNKSTSHRIGSSSRARPALPSSGSSHSNGR